MLFKNSFIFLLIMQLKERSCSDYQVTILQVL